MIETNTTINFSSAAPGDDGGYLEILVSDHYEGATPVADEYNYDSQAPPAVKSEFLPTESPWLLVLGSDLSIMYSVQTSFGTATQRSQGLSYKIQESIQFVNSMTGSLRYIPKVLPDGTSVSYEWQPSSNPEIDEITVLFTGRDVTLSAPVIGTLNVTYVTNGDHWQLAITWPDDYDEDSLDVTVVATQGDLDSNTTARFVQDTGAEAGEVVAYKIEFYNVCDPSETVPNVNFTWGSSPTQHSSGTDGYYLGELSDGTYAIVGTKTGYFGTADDVLDNDEVVIPVPE